MYCANTQNDHTTLHRITSHHITHITILCCNIRSRRLTIPTAETCIASHDTQALSIHGFGQILHSPTFAQDRLYGIVQSYY